MSKKVVITISGGQHYAPSHKGGREFVSVSYSGSTYGGASPCDTEEEVQSAIAAARESIRRAGDIPVVEDNRVTLMRFM